MVLEEQILPYFQWFFGAEGVAGALPRYFMIAAAVGFLALVIGYLISAARYGLVRGGDVVYRTVSSGFRELSQTSPRRVWALAQLAIKEARRRRVEVALVVFQLVLEHGQPKPSQALHQLRVDRHHLPGTGHRAAAERL